ncbi:ScbR family autoregulator-binding transcription factor [Streptomyces sp. NPDC059740]|uniref:ScbR family autoregulator-binding transcription factor n=1 Tax=Streptomyces sp. NPDC059740 TaxID=3346926 RepID=UPI003659387C
MNRTQKGTVVQERAERTRSALVRAAATEIDRRGFHGASLTGISRSIGMSMGALTFHFPVKDQLIAAVHSEAATVMRQAVTAAFAEPGPALTRTRAVLLTVVRLLEEEPVVRAAARLSTERPQTGDDWTTAWLPTVRASLREAREQGALGPHVDPETATALVAGILAGFESWLRRPTGMPPASRHVASIWDCVEPALAAHRVTAAAL